MTTTPSIGAFSIRGDLAGHGRRLIFRVDGTAWHSTAASVAMPSMGMDFIDCSLGIAVILMIYCILLSLVPANK